MIKKRAISSLSLLLFFLFFVVVVSGGVSVTHAYEWTTFVVRSAEEEAAAKEEKVGHDGRGREGRQMLPLLLLLLEIPR